MKKQSLKWIKIALVVVIVVLSIIFLKKYSLHEIRSIIDSYGEKGPIIYIALFSILPLFMFPVPILVLAAGLAFGVTRGILYTMVGTLINAILMYYLGRFIAKDALTEILNRKSGENLKEKLLSDNQKTLFTVFFILRLVPLVSFNLINYASGITSIKLPQYLISTLLGILPGLYVFLNAGDKSLHIGSKAFIISMVMLVLLIIISLIILRIYLKRNKDGNGNNTHI